MKDILSRKQSIENNNYLLFENSMKSIPNITDNDKKDFKISKYLKIFESEDFLTQLKAQFFFKVSIAFSGFMFLLLMFTIFIQNTYYARLDLLVITLQIICFVLSLLAIRLITRGRLNLPFHYMLIMSFSFIWIVIFYEDSVLIPRVDSICFTYAMLSLTALLAGQKRKAIIVYSSANLICLTAFCIYVSYTGQIKESDAIEFFVDNLLAYIFIATVSYNIHVIYNKSINKTNQALSAAKTAENELRKLNETLEEKVLERTKELNEALRKLEESNIEYYLLNEKVTEEARLLQITNEKLTVSEQRLMTSNQTKDKFFSIIAHDLRGPLGSFQSCAQMLYEKAEIIDKQQLSTLLRSLKDTSSNVYTLLENLLSWSRSQQGLIKISKESLILSKEIQSSINNVNPIAKDKRIEIISNVLSDAVIYTDSILFTTIIRNLLSNAVKFSFENSKIEINCAETNYSENFNNSIVNKDFYKISIKDNGIGMDELTLQKLFKIEIHHSKRGTKNEAGTGLGLLICKEFVELLDGRIWAESKLNEGTVFNIIIPK